MLDILNLRVLQSDYCVGICLIKPGTNEIFFLQFASVVPKVHNDIVLPFPLRVSFERNNWTKLFSSERRKKRFIFLFSGYCIGIQTDSGPFVLFYILAFYFEVILDNKKRGCKNQYTDFSENTLSFPCSARTQTAPVQKFGGILFC